MNKIREQLDYTWHKKETNQQIKDHDEIIQHIVNQSNAQSCQKPVIVFMAGCFGSGKSHLMRQHLKQDQHSYSQQLSLIPNKGIVFNDPDQIKYMLHTTVPVSERHAEACTTSELLTRYCLDQSYSVIVDGSLRDADWHIQFFNFIRTMYPSYQIIVLFVKVDSFDTIVERVQKRCTETGRCINLAVLKNVFEQIPHSVKKVTDHVDHLIEITNN